MRQYSPQGYINSQEILRRGASVRAAAYGVSIRMQLPGVLTHAEVSLSVTRVCESSAVLQVALMSSLVQAWMEPSLWSSPVPCLGWIESLFTTSQGKKKKDHRQRNAKLHTPLTQPNL